MAFDLKRTYYYIICLVSFFVLMWGVVDLIGAGISLVGLKSSGASMSAPMDASVSPEKGDQFFDTYYQAKMSYDRLWDSLARIVVAGGIFYYSRKTANRLEQQG
jgi:hypothetical protein